MYIVWVESINSRLKPIVINNTQQWTSSSLTKLTLISISNLLSLV